MLIGSSTQLDPGFPWLPLAEMQRLSLEDVAYETLLLPNGDGWAAPCGTPNPWVGHPLATYGRHLPS